MNNSILKKLKRLPIARPSNFPLMVAICLFILFFTIGSVRYRGFQSWQVFANLFIDNAHLMIVAFGETLVLISGGIDLSVNSVVAFGCMLAAYTITILGWPVWLAIIIVLLMGALVGLLNGYLVTYRRFQPFIATLSTQFLLRGACYIISVDTIVISAPEFVNASLFKLRFPGGTFISLGVIVAMVVLVIFQYITQKSKFGRNVYAIGGNEQSAKLMGLPVERTKMMVYVVSGVTAAVASLVFAIFVLSAYGMYADGMHLDAVASAVIGGTLTTGGVGSVLGSVVGVITVGIIQTLITFQGNLNSWWARIAVAALLLLFIAIQRLIVIGRSKK